MTDQRGGKPGFLLIGAAVGAIAAVAVIALNSQSQVAGGPAPGLQALPPAAIDWNAVARDYRNSTANAVKAVPSFRRHAKQLDAVQIPVLLPHAGPNMNTTDMVFIPGVHTYTVSLPDPTAPGVHIAVSGDSVYVQVAPGTIVTNAVANVPINGQAQKIIVTPTESGQLATFTRYGIVYTVEVDCDTPDTAAKFCDGNGYIQQVIGGMTDVVLGAPAERTMRANAKTPIDQGPPPPTTADLEKAAAAKARQEELVRKNLRGVLSGAAPKTSQKASSSSVDANGRPVGKP